MSCTKPHYLLFCDCNGATGEGAHGHRGKWRFVLEDVASGERTEAADIEPGCAPDRCALISVLRGLESLEQPSRVTLVTPNRYVTRGLLYGLNEWRENDFSWEHFGAVQPIRNADLWRRIDRTLAFHQVQCRWMAADESTGVGENLEEASTTRSGVPGECESVKELARGVSAANLADSTQQLVDTPSSSAGATATRCSVSTTRTKRIAKGTLRQEVDSSLRISEPRIFRDSAHVFLAEQTSPHAISSVLHDVENLESIDQTKQKLPQGNRWKNNPSMVLFRCFSFVLQPISVVVGGANKLWHRVWDAILALDEWLESFLRCLFLLNPRDRRSKR